MEFLLLDGRDDEGRAEFARKLYAPPGGDPSVELFRLLGVA